MTVSPDAGAVVLRFPLERRLAAIRAEREAEEASEGHAGVARGSLDVRITNCTVPVDVVTADYVRSYGFFGVRLRPQ